ncbi:hypothetical protein ACWD3J_41385 [Streptomyces sp. NPDC002755]|uniref:hypothetical protein n=1 Tax=Streptomyces sp. NPDC002884 TaxID=3154544 RepID=UPI00332F8ED0
MVNSVPQHLHSEDRQEYERILDEALRSAPHYPELAAIGHRLNSEQLRTMALNATSLITAAAAAEYQHYVKAREELRDPAKAAAVPHRNVPAAPLRRHTAGIGRRVLAGILGVEHRSGRQRDRGGFRQLPLRLRFAAAFLGARPRPVVHSHGSVSARGVTLPGRAAALTITTSLFFGTLGLLCLVTGYGLKWLGSATAAADWLIVTGLVLGGIMILVSLGGVIRLIGTALREAATSPDARPDAPLSQEVARAKAAWHQALLERGILPFLREALAEPGTVAALRPDSAPPDRAGRIPQTGYARPGFSSPDDGLPGGPRPSFTSPDYTSPDFGGPEHQRE